MNKKKLFIIIGAVLLVLITIIILILPKGKLTETRITKIVMAKGVTKDKQAVNPTDVFSTNDSEIYAVITVLNLPANTPLQYRWYDVNSKETLQSSERKSTALFSGNSTDVIKKSYDLTWDKGDYEFRVSLGGKVIAKKEYLVRTPGEIEQTKAISSIKEVNLTTAVDLRGNPTAATKTMFRTDDEEIYASVAHQDTPSGTNFEAKWIYIKEDRLIKSYKKTLSGDGVFAFSIKTKEDSWIPIKKWERGKYELEIYVSGELVREISFTVQ